MSTIKQALRNPAILAVIAALAVLGTTANAQTEPEKLDDPRPTRRAVSDFMTRADSLTDVQIEKPASRAKARGNLPPSAVYRCDYEMDNGRRGWQVTGLYVPGGSTTGTYSAIHPNGWPAPTHEFQLTFLGYDIFGTSHWDYVGKGGELTCWLYVELDGQKVGLLSCSTGLKLMTCVPIT